MTKQRKRNKNFLEKSSPGIHFELIFSTGVVKTGVAKTGVAKNGFKDYVLTKLSHQDTNVVSQRFPNCVFITNQFFQTIFTIKALLWKASQESRAPKWGAVNSIFGVGG
ncbi:MAG: hypothetical protein LBF22_03785 [Deltaproteobacteria bacterium]|nr:hypothetical protein [Deltaproteobacteria bacterium]